MTEEEIRRYIKQLMSNGEQWKAIKMVVLGNGRIGKTTLLRSIDQILSPSLKVRYVRFFFFHLCKLLPLTFNFCRKVRPLKAQLELIAACLNLRGETSQCGTSLVNKNTL